MRTWTWSLVAIVLSVSVGRADDPPLERAKPQEVERLGAIEAYYRKAGKPTTAEYYRQVAERAENPKPARVSTVYVPVLKSDGLTRQDALRLTEILIRSIERESLYKVVGSPDEADLIFEGRLTPRARPKP